MKLLVRRDALEKLVDAFESLLVEVPRDPSDRERTMLRWFREFLSDDVSPVDRVVRKLGTLKVGWERPLSQVEMHELNGSLDTLATFTDSEWQDIAEWLSYKPKSWEKLYQVQNRQSFLRAPVDTLTAAESWKDQNRPSRRSQAPVNAHAGEVLSVEEMRAILRGEGG
jgi:hypothetical protein